MARAKNGSNVRRIVKNRWFVLIAIVVLVLFTIYRIVVFINHKNDQRLLLEDLERSGEILDEITEDFKRDIPESVSTRDKYCYRASRKFEDGPIFCGQTLEINTDSLAEEILDNRVDYINNYLRQAKYFNFVKKESKNENFMGFFSQTSHRHGGCDYTIYKKPDHGKYEFNLSCVSGEFDSFIYPEQADY